MSEPKRIQLSRAKGWRKPQGAISVARPTRWGNPFYVGDEVSVSVGNDLATITMTQQMAVDCFADLMRGRVVIQPDDHPDDVAYAQSWIDGLAELRGHDLACWCALGDPCHVDVLLKVANS